jgi:hypothetical protein
MARKDIERLHAASRDELEYPRFRGSKTRSWAQKLFEEGRRIRGELRQPG